MQSLFGLLFLISIPTFALAMFRPTYFSKFNKGIVPSRWILALISLTLSLIFLAMIGVTSPVDKVDRSETENDISTIKSAVNSKGVVQNQSATAQRSLNITHEEFRERFNAASEKVDGSFHINKIELKDGPVFDAANIKLSNNNALVLSVTKDGKVESATTISSGDGSLESGTDMLFLSIILVRAINDQLDEKQSSKIALDLMRASTSATSDEFNSKIIDGVKYFSTYSKTLGYWFGAEAAM